MSKKFYALLSTITTAISAVAIAIVTYFTPEHMAAINASIPVLEGAIITIAGNFVKEE
jgi:hypothetical protein